MQRRQQEAEVNAMQLNSNNKENAGSSVKKSLYMRGVTTSADIIPHGVKNDLMTQYAFRLPNTTNFP
jgi:hypothetical protein